MRTTVPGLVRLVWVRMVLVGLGCPRLTLQFVTFQNRGHMFFIVKYSMVAVAFYLIMSGLISVDFSDESFGLSVNFSTASERIIEDISTLVRL